MVNLKLETNNKVNDLPREKSTVKAALLRAMDDAQKQSWSKVIIIGRNKDFRYSMRHTKEYNEVLLGILSVAQSMVIKDVI